MNKNQKAIAQLEGIGIPAKEYNETVYVFIEDVGLELAEFEIDFQAKLYDEQKKSDNL